MQPPRRAPNFTASRNARPHDRAFDNTVAAAFLDAEYYYFILLIAYFELRPFIRKLIIVCITMAVKIIRVFVASLAYIKRANTDYFCQGGNKLQPAIAGRKCKLKTPINE